MSVLLWLALAWLVVGVRGGAWSAGRRSGWPRSGTRPTASGGRPGPAPDPTSRLPSPPSPLRAQPPVARAHAARPDPRQRAATPRQTGRRVSQLTSRHLDEEDLMDRLRFGTFLAPFHPAGENPTLALQRDLELVEHLDRLRLRRGVDRRAPLGRHRDHRLAGDLHRRGGRADPADQARHRRHLDRLPQPALGGRAHGAAGPPHPGPGDARLRAGVAAHRLDDAGPQPHRHPRADGGRPRHHHAAAARGDGHREDPHARAGRRPAAPAALHPAVLRHRRRRGRLPHRAADGRAARRRAAVHRRHPVQGRLRRAGPPLERRGGAGRALRADGRPRRTGGWSA